MRRRPDADGRFQIVLDGEAASLQFQADGYLETSVEVDRSAAQAALEVRLFPEAFAETVEVVSEMAVQERPSATPVAPEAVFRAPGSIDNVFRTLDTLAGVASTDDFGSRLAVRGGTPDQNLTVMDGIEVHNPYRLFGIASAFNPETVESFELTAGGFGAAYGDRLSSILVVDNRAGRPGFEASTAASITDANVVLEGTTPIGADGTWLLSARRTYYDLVAGRVADQNFPSFADLQLQAGWDLGPGHQLTLTGLRSVEDADLSLDFDDSDDRAALGSDVTNGLASARFDAVLGPRATATTVVSWYRNRESLRFDGLIRAEATRSNAPDDDVAFGRSAVAFDRAIEVADRSVRQDLSVQVSPRHLLNTGIELHRLDTGYRWLIAGDRNDLQANGSSVQGGAGLPDDLDSLVGGTRGGLWLQDTWTPSERFSFEPGLRLDWSTVNGGATLSPRLAASYALGGGARVRAAGGLYTQSPGYEKLSQSDYFIDLSGAREAGLRHERATHLVLGLEQDLGRDVTARVEGLLQALRRSPSRTAGDRGRAAGAGRALRLSRGAAGQCARRPHHSQRPHQRRGRRRVRARRLPGAREPGRAAHGVGLLRLGAGRARELRAALRLRVRPAPRVQRGRPLPADEPLGPRRDAAARQRVPPHPGARAAGGGGRGRPGPAGARHRFRRQPAVHRRLRRRREPERRPVAALCPRRRARHVPARPRGTLVGLRRGHQPARTRQRPGARAGPAARPGSRAASALGGPLAGIPPRPDLRAALPVLAAGRIPLQHSAVCYVAGGGSPEDTTGFRRWRQPLRGIRRLFARIQRETGERCETTAVRLALTEYPRTQRLRRLGGPAGTVALRCTNDELESLEECRTSCPEGRGRASRAPSCSVPRRRACVVRA